MADRNEVKALLARAGIEISDALKTVDTMDDRELEETASNIKKLETAFFDFNGSCGSLTEKDLVAFFDFNGSCGSSMVRSLTSALNVRRNRMDFVVKDCAGVSCAAQSLLRAHARHPY